MAGNGWKHSKYGGAGFILVNGNTLFEQYRIWMFLGFLSGSVYTACHAIWYLYLSGFQSTSAGLAVLFDWQGVIIFIVYTFFVSTIYLMIWLPFLFSLGMFRKKISLKSHILYFFAIIYGIVVPIGLMNLFRIGSHITILFVSAASIVSATVFVWSQWGAKFR